MDSIENAAAWYGKHFGFRRIRKDAQIDRIADGKDHPMFRIYGNDLNTVRLAWLSAGNGIGFEIFEFVDPPVKSAEELRREFTLQGQCQRGGVFHIAITAPDPEGVAERACEDGAARIGETIDVAPGEKALYLRDPWGMVIEVLSANYERLLSSWE